MRPALLLLFLLLLQGILTTEIDCFSLTRVEPERGVRVLNATVGLDGESYGEKPGGKITALSRKGSSGGGSAGGGRGGRGAPGSGGTDIAHRPRTKVSAAPSTSSDPLFLAVMGLACGSML